jgi:hypothetical protein
VRDRTLNSEFEVIDWEDFIDEVSDFAKNKNRAPRSSLRRKRVALSYADLIINLQCAMSARLISSQNLPILENGDRVRNLSDIIIKCPISKKQS